MAETNQAASDNMPAKAASATPQSESPTRPESPPAAQPADSAPPGSESADSQDAPPESPPSPSVAAESPPEVESDHLDALPPAELAQQVRAGLAENAQLQDALLRARAEVENIRRRSQNEMTAARKFAIENFAQQLLGVRDSLERASAVQLDAAAAAVQPMKEGLELTLKQFDLAMAKFAVLEVAAAPGMRFDPQQHQAIGTAPAGEVAADHIVVVVQKGFLLNQRLLRPAMVMVAAET